MPAALSALCALARPTFAARLPHSPPFATSQGVSDGPQRARRGGGGDNGDDAMDMVAVERRRRIGVLSLRRQKKVWRHLRSGDMMLANRQPTLHKPSIMAHKVRVISNKNMQTIRLHYANCNTYNADFDGDEINLHFPQNELARAEAETIAFASKQYCSNTDGGPLRGLIQDHVGQGVMLTRRGTFLNRDEYTQLVFSACDAMDVVDSTGTTCKRRDIKMLPPTIMFPRELWTGKQVISTLIHHMCVSTPRPNYGPGKTKTNAKAWTVWPKGSTCPEDRKGKALHEAALKLVGEVGGSLGETQVIVRDGKPHARSATRAHAATHAPRAIGALHPAPRIAGRSHRC